jgi:hypothetical protein
MDLSVGADLFVEATSLYRHDTASPSPTPLVAIEIIALGI